MNRSSTGSCHQLVPTSPQFEARFIGEALGHNSTFSLVLMAPAPEPCPSRLPESGGLFASSFPLAQTHVRLPRPSLRLRAQTRDDSGELNPTVLLGREVPPAPPGIASEGRACRDDPSAGERRCFSRYELGPERSRGNLLRCCACHTSETCHGCDLYTRVSAPTILAKPREQTHRACRGTIDTTCATSESGHV